MWIIKCSFLVTNPLSRGIETLFWSYNNPKKKKKRETTTKFSINKKETATALDQLEKYTKEIACRITCALAVELQIGTNNRIS